jgi:hypothetical protein
MAKGEAGPADRPPQPFVTEQRRRWNEVMTERLVRGFPELAGKIIGFCWPYKGEFNARFAICQLRERGRRCRRWWSARDRSSFASGGRVRRRNRGYTAFLFRWEPKW